MLLETAKRVVAVAKTLELDVEIRTDYAYRGGFGRSTAALVGIKQDILECIAELIPQIAHDVLITEDLELLSWDAMGKYDSICY